MQENAPFFYCIELKCMMNNRRVDLPAAGFASVWMCCIVDVMVYNYLAVTTSYPKKPNGGRCFGFLFFKELAENLLRNTNSYIFYLSVHQ